VSSDLDRRQRNRIVIETPPPRYQRSGRPFGRRPAPKTREGLLAISVIAAAALATFLALLLTSRPYDPMNSTTAPQQVVPQGPSMMQPSPKQSPTPTPPAQQNQVSPEQKPEPAGETARPVPADDAAIQAQIEKVLAADAMLSKLDISTIVEGGKVTVVGSVGSSDLKQRVERVLHSVKGVVAVDNQLVVREATP
jgi:type IV secretory pathway VirB10-like protein